MSVRSIVFATQTLPAPTVIALAPRPTGIVSVIRYVRGSTRTTASSQLVHYPGSAFADGDAARCEREPDRGGDPSGRRIDAPEPAIRRVFPSTQTPERSVAIPDRPSRKLADVSARGYGIAAYPTMRRPDPRPARAQLDDVGASGRPDPLGASRKTAGAQLEPVDLRSRCRVVLGHVAAELRRPGRADVRAAAVDSDIVGSTDVLELGDGRRSRVEQPEPTLSERGDPDPIVPGRERARMAPDDRNLLGPARPGVDSEEAARLRGGLRSCRHP